MTRRLDDRVFASSTVAVMFFVAAAVMAAMSALFVPDLRPCADVDTSRVGRCTVSGWTDFESLPVKR